MKKRPFDTFRTVLSEVKIPWILILISIVSSFVMTNAMMGTAVITAKIVDSSGNLQVNDLIRYIVLLVGSGMLAAVGNLSNSYLSEKINIGVRSKVWKKLLRLPMKYYDEESGEALVSRITVDCNRASSFFSMIILTTVSLYGLYLAIVNMLEFSPTLTLWSLTLIPFVTLGVALSGRLVFKFQSLVHQTHSDATEYLLERVKNLRLVRTSNMVSEEIKAGQNQFQRMFSASIKAMLSDDLMASFMGIVPVALIIVTFIVGSILVSQNAITLGEVIGFYSVSAMASIRINVLITSYGDLVSANGVFDKISRILKAEEENTEGVPMDIPDEDIIVDHISFSYGDKKVFEDLSCVIPAHQVTAIIGDNGCGKTTLIKLLERMYEPDEGQIRFGQKPIAEFDRNSWRSAFALVSQNRPLLSGTIRDNLTYGCTRSVTEEELILASRQAGIEELIRSLPEGFDTTVEPNGSNFSGGQRQCMAIARAIMRNPDYLLLDEATSNLDSQSEKMVTKALNNIMEGRTTIMIAHSLSAISHANHIIVMKNGKIEAAGSPEQVSKESEFFRQFIESQCIVKEG